MKKNYFVNNNELYFAKIRPSAIIPTKKDEDAGYDIYADISEPISIKPGETRLVPTGIACAVATGFYLQIEERSSIGSQGLKKSAGIIDSGYRGEIFIALTNTTNRRFVLANNLEEVNKGDSVRYDDIILPTSTAIAQLIVHRVYRMRISEIPYNELKEIPSERKTGGFGSSGK